MVRKDRRATLEGLATSIAENHDFGTIAGREPFTSDLAAFEYYIEKMRKAERLDQDPAFNEKFWAYVRTLLEKATPSGFTESAENSFQIKTTEDVDVVVEKMRLCELLLPCSPNLVAKETRMSLPDVLSELFYATQIGLTDMLWTPECDRCGGSVCHKGMLENLPKATYCDGCLSLTKSEYLDQIKVVFVLSPSVFYVPVIRVTNFPFAALDAPVTHLLAVGAPTSKDSGFSYLLGTENGPKALAKGQYRIVCPYTGVDCALKVERDATGEDEFCHAEMRASNITKPEFGHQIKTLTIPHGKVSLDVIADTASVFMLLVMDFIADDALYTLPKEYRIPFLSAAECLHHPSFHKLFPNQIVTRNALFKIQRVVLVFTDVVGSTALYESAGDGPALDIVQSHFQVLFSSLTKTGRVVKTVGDAVMAAFMNGRDAIMAVADGLGTLPSECKLPDGTSLSIRVGIHSGSAVVVPLNGINDYFGSTVNISARVEGKAEPAECLVSEAVLEDPAANAAYDELTTGGAYEATRSVTLTLKGVPNPMRCKGFRSRGQPGAYEH